MSQTDGHRRDNTLHFAEHKNKINCTSGTTNEVVFWHARVFLSVIVLLNHHESVLLLYVDNVYHKQQVTVMLNRFEIQWGETANFEFPLEPMLKMYDRAENRHNLLSRWSEQILRGDLH